MEDLAAKQRIYRSLSEVLSLLGDDCGSAAVYSKHLYTCQRRTTCAKHTLPREATQPLATQAIAEHKMAQVEYAFPVDKIHGKVSKSHKIGFAHRNSSKKNYTTAYGKRSTPFSTDEVARQTKFGAVATAARARMQDPSKMTADQEAFREQTKYKTMYQYLFNLEWESYEG